MVDDRELIERLRKDADRQDGEEESIVSTNCMRNAADRLQSLLSDRDKLEEPLAEAGRLVAQWDATEQLTPDDLYLFTEALVGAVRAALRSTDNG